jgi:hypothetical protein
MSYILDALKRAEQQRGGAARASVRAPREMPLDGASRGPWPWIAATAVGVGAVVAAVALWPISAPPPGPVAVPGAVAGRTAPPEPAVRPGSVQPAPIAAPLPSARPAPSVSRAPESRASVPTVAERGAISRAARPQSLERDGASRASTAPAAPAAPAAPPSALTDLTPPPVPSAPQSEVTPAPRPDQVVSAVRPAPRVEDTPASVRPTPRPEARAATPPAPEVAPPAGGEVKALAAKISLQVLSWAPDPKDRFVFLNGRRYGEGQVIDDKLLVERITEDGVVLSYRGERVTLKGR